MMEQLLIQLSGEYSLLFFARQTAVILVIFLYGFIVCSCINSFNDRIYNVLLAFPAGLSVFGICGLVLLITGIKYCVLSIAAVMIPVIIIILIINRKRLSVPAFSKKSVFTALLVIAVALISVSGIISTGFSNDSMYYYSEYPRAVVGRGYLYYGFDAFLTDAGQTTMVVNTLPYLFGFDEAFGVHAFFNINFAAFFAYAVFEQAYKRFDKRKSVLFSALFTALLFTSMPFVLISKWNIANVYFMEQMFICLYLFFKAHDENINITAVMTVLLCMLSFMRIEGALYSALVLVCAMTLKDVKSKEIVYPAVCVLAFQSAYYVKIFILTKIYASYTFMTRGKAVVIIAAFILLTAFALIFADSDKIRYNESGMVSSIKARLNYVNLSALYIAALVIVNIAVLFYDRDSYIEAVRTLFLNVVRSSGWGIFPAVAVALIILMPKVKIQSFYFELFCICFVLISIAACSLRGGGLRVSFADSGNRVLMQIVPFVIYMFAYRFILGFHVSQRDSEV